MSSSIEFEGSIKGEISRETHVHMLPADRYAIKDYTDNDTTFMVFECSPDDMTSRAGFTDQSNLRLTLHSRDRFEIIDSEQVTFLHEISHGQSEKIQIKPTRKDSVIDLILTHNK